MSISALLASIAALLVSIASSVGIPTVDTTTTTRATSTPPVSVSTTTAPKVTPTKTPAIPAPAATVPAKTPTAPANAIAPMVPPVQIVPPPTFKAEGETPALAQVLPRVRSATVNIICTPTERGIRGISGSGVIIDSRGVILTAAHVAQFVLFQDSKFSCVVRTGSPATKAYTADLIYISPNWIRANAGVMTASNPTGTGEDDFALLAVTGSATDVPLPSAYPSVPLSLDDPKEGDPIVIGSYGAEFLDSQRIRSSLFPTLVFSSVKQRYTFHSTTVDILSLGGGAAAQEGSSGGSAVNEQGRIIGTITTSSTGPDIATRDLHAITPSHIRRSFSQDRGETMDAYIADNSLSTLISNFSDQAKSLADLIAQANNF